MRAFSYLSLSFAPVMTDAVITLLLGQASPPISATPFDPIHLIYVAGTALLGYLFKQEIDRNKEERKDLKQAISDITAMMTKLDRRLLRLELGAPHAAEAPSDPNVGRHGR